MKTEMTVKEAALLKLQEDSNLTYKQIVNKAKLLELELPEMAYELDRVVAKLEERDEFSDINLKAEFDQVLKIMQDSVKHGLAKESELKTMPGDYATKCHKSELFKDLEGVAFGAALAVVYHSARHGTVAAAPTCGSAGVLPGVLYAFKEVNGVSSARILDALKVAAIGGLIAFKRGSVSGAKAGCGAEMGIAAIMAAMAAAWLLECTPEEIGNAGAFAGTMFPGLECSPEKGRVEYPCILRNGFATGIAIKAAKLAKSGASPKYSIEDVVLRIFATGACLPVELRETESGLWMKQMVDKYLKCA